MQPRIAELCTKCLDQTATPAERQELLQWLAAPGQEADAATLIRDAFIHHKQLETLSAATASDMITSILQGSDTLTNRLGIDVSDMTTSTLQGIDTSSLSATGAGVDAGKPDGAGVEREPVMTTYEPGSTASANTLQAMDALKTGDAAVEPALEPLHAIEPEYSIDHSSTPYRRLRRWSWAAAAILLLLAGSYFWINNSESTKATPQTAKGDRAPGHDGAVLTLEDGSEVVLDEHENGVVATQHGSQVILQDGKLAYDAGEAAAGAMVYNTMTTPRGRQFNITLSDGTKVWLNAASSITYPTAFTGDKRQVSITGEAYFEVAKDATRPFFITINNKATARVLGTAFNINAYQEEASLQTTLLEGSLQVIAGDSNTAAGQVILQPGEQARIDNKENTGTASGQKANAGTASGNKASTGAHKSDGNAAAGSIRVSKANIEKVMAWHHGLFHFEDLTVEEAMLQLARWYDIDVIYDKEFNESAVRQQMLSGEIRRDLTLSNVLELLQALGLHFRLEGSKLTVLP